MCVWRNAFGQGAYGPHSTGRKGFGHFQEDGDSNSRRWLAVGMGTTATIFLEPFSEHTGVRVKGYERYYTAFVPLLRPYLGMTTTNGHITFGRLDLF